MSLQLSRSINGWHALWFHLKNDVAAPLLDFTGRLIEEALPVWGWRPLDKEKKRLRYHLNAIALLNQHGLRGTDVIRAYHTSGTADGACPSAI
jgi:hypothetical protein